MFEVLQKDLNQLEAEIETSRREDVTLISQNFTLNAQTA